MSGFSASSTCAASAEQVWEVLTDWQGGLRWRPGMEAVEVDGHDGTTRLRWTSRGSLREASVTAWSPPHQLTVHYQQGPVSADYRWTLGDDGSHTQITLEVSTSATGATRLMLPVFTEMMRRSDEALPSALSAEVMGR